MRTIRGRLLVTLLGGVAAVLVVGGVAVYLIARGSLVRQLDDELEARALAISSLVSMDSGTIEYEFDEGELAATRGVAFEIRTSFGEVLRRSDGLAEDAFRMPDRWNMRTTFGDVGLVVEGEPVSGRLAWMSFRPRVEVDDEDDENDENQEDEDELDGIGPEGTPRQAPTAAQMLVIGVAVPSAPVDRALATLLGALLAVGAALAATLGVLVPLGVRWSLGPLGRIGRQIGAIGGKTISTRLDETDAPGEIAPIVAELNRMLDRVEHTLQRERSFADAAAHELRTPLAELRATAEVAVTWPEPERVGAALREVLAVGKEMERLVEALLLISRGNASAMKGRVARTPLGTVVRESLRSASGEIRDKRLRLAVELDDVAELDAPRDAVEIIVRNLIDNAVHYTPREGSITVAGNGVDGQPPGLVVENGPVSLREEDLPRLFEPFWRMERARSDRGHVGLGLAVVHNVARAIGLRAEATLRGDRLRIRLLRRT